MEDGMELIRVDDTDEERPPERQSRQTSLLYAVGGIALVGLAAMVVLALPDIKRYIRISTM